MRKLIIIAVLFTGVICLKCFCEKETEGFSLLGISSNRPYDPSWETSSLSSEEEKEVKQALSQSFRYFGCGGQSYIFFSDDGRYAIKFFKQRLFQPPIWLNIPLVPWLFPKYAAKKKWQREDKLKRDFSSYVLAFKELKTETGLLYVHLNKTSHLKEKTKLIDRLNICHLVDLNQFDFVLQRKADLVYDRIVRQMNEGNIEEAKKTISRILDFISSRCKKGFHDRDPNIRTNCGFIDDQPIKIDVGRISKEEKFKNDEYRIKELEKIAHPFKLWLKQCYPLLAEHLDQEMLRLAHEENPI